VGGNRRCVSDRMGWNITKGSEVGQWVAKRIQGGYFEGRSEAIGLERDGELVAGVIYENWNHRSIWCHIAIEGRLTPEYLAAIFDYPFNTCQVEKIIVPVGSDNEQSIKVVKKMGFTEEGRIKEGRPHGDIVFYTLRRDDCRFLNTRYSKRIANHG
jgi:RimJ/RimL family protein N-acetyltransferase